MTAPYYSDDLVTLWHGDCTSPDMARLADCMEDHLLWLDADVLVTDPPYGVRWSSGGFSNARVALVESIEGDDDTSIRDAALRLWGARPALVFGSWRMWRPEGVNNRLIWHKASNIPGHRTQPWFSADEEIYQIGTGFTGKPEQNVIVTHDRRDGAHGEVAKIGHPTPKPVSLMGRLLAKCPPGIIADPFAGSGSTLIAAKMLGRRAIGVELDERYCEIAAKRLAQDTLFGGAA